MEILSTIAGHFVTLILGLASAFLLHRREMKKKNLELSDQKKTTEDFKIKAEVLNRVLDFSSFNLIKDAVDEMFLETKADRFLILIAINGQTDFNIVSVIFEQHKTADFQVNAIARYKDLPIDEAYRSMLKHAEREGQVLLETEKIERSLLGELYRLEGVEHSVVKHILRIKADERNDILVYSSLATHNSRSFTNLELRKVDLIHNSSLKPIINNVLNPN